MAIEISPDESEHSVKITSENVEKAEANLRFFERRRLALKPEDMKPAIKDVSAGFPQKPFPGGDSIEPISEQPGQNSSPVDTSDEWWNRRETPEPEPVTLIDNIKRIALAGTTGAVLLGSSLMLHQEAIAPEANTLTNSPDQMNTIQVEPSKESPITFVEQETPLHLEQTAEGGVSTSKWEVPVQSQHGLTYRGVRTDFGCTPTSTSMVLDFYHQQNPDNLTMSAQDLLDTNAAQGEFHATGMSPSHIADEVDRLGYTSTDHLNSNFEELKSAVEKGPVIAVVKLNMAASGENHSVVVTGISGKNEVHVNDPWIGESKTYSWAQFSKSWGADFGNNVSINNFTEIRPR
jgi:predicted double-glycine peptidase